MTLASRLDAPTVAGLALRVNDRGTAPAAEMAVIANAVNVFDGIDDHVATAELENWLGYTSTGFDPARDVVLAEVDGTLVGYAWVDWVDTTEGFREFRLGGYVHPDWQGRGIGRNLLAWQEQHAATHPAVTTERPMSTGTWLGEARERKRHLFERAGYETSRFFFDMLRPTLDDIDLPPLPEGLEVRPIGTDRESLRRMWDADVEAFTGDHWGGFDGSDGAFERSLADPDQDPSLWIAGWDGDEIAGGVINTIYADDNAAFGRKRGWLDGVFVRRPWRRRGLASALVALALVRLREAGMEEAMLGVDSENPSGALGLYERAGFQIHRRSRAYRRLMDANR